MKNPSLYKTFPCDGCITAIMCRQRILPNYKKHIRSCEKLSIGFLTN